MTDPNADGRLADALSRLPQHERRRILATMTDLTGRTANAALHMWPLWARDSQLTPPGDWQIWLLLAGRGFGKTRTGAEWVRSRVESGRARNIALVARTPADARDVMIEGDSGLLSVCPPSNRPAYESSRKRLTWPNGAVATTYSNIETARRMFWETCVVPELRFFEEKLTENLLPMFGDRSLLAEFDTSSIEALRESESERARRIQIYVSEGIMTPEEARAELGLGPHPGEGRSARTGDSSSDSSIRESSPLSLYRV